MKIVCDNCATKYSIADEKVRGKVFKIRCKKCSHVIVVKGEEGGATTGGDGPSGELGYENEESTSIAPTSAPPAAAGTGATGDSVWHLVIDREQVGPMTADEVRAKFTAGQCDAETYAWREGFGDWLRLGSIDEFRDLNTKAANEQATMMGSDIPPEVAALAAQRNGSSPVSEEAGTNRTDAADVFASHQASHAEEEDGGASDLFGAAPATTAAMAPSFGDDPFAPASSASAKGMDFASAAASSPSSSHDSFGGGGGGMGFPSSGGESLGESFGDANGAGPKLIGERNENSALFSLSNLQALASNKPERSSAPLPGTAAPASRPGYATAANEGSGLIDIRAMAQQTMSSAPAPSFESSSSAMDLPSLGAPPVFSPVVAAPILMPSSQSGMPKWIWGVIAGGGVLVVAIIALLVVVVTRKPEGPQYVYQTAPTAAAPAAVPVAVAPVAAAPAAAVPGTAPTAVASADDKGAKHHAADHHASGTSKPASGERPAAADHAAAPTAAAPEAAPAPAAGKPKKHDSLDDLLDDAAPTPKSDKHKPAAAAVDESLPDQLNRDQIKAGMTSVQGRALGCFQQFHVPGTALAAVSIGGAGRISSCDVKGVLAGTPTGDCVCKAVKSASFGKFKGSPMSVTYPFILR